MPRHVFCLENILCPSTPAGRSAAADRDPSATPPWAPVKIQPRKERVNRSATYPPTGIKSTPDCLEQRMARPGPSATPSRTPMKIQPRWVFSSALREPVEKAEKKSVVRMPFTLPSPAMLVQCLSHTTVVQHLLYNEQEMHLRAWLCCCYTLHSCIHISSVSLN